MCTGIKIDYYDGCVLGRNMDYEVPVDYNVLYLPRNYNFCNDLMGKPLYSKYKILGVCFHNRDPLKDGINEHGLMGITNSFSGFAGCNGMSGQLFYEKELLRFTKIITTMMYCGDTNKEREFLKALNSATKYTIENNRLTLSNPSKELMVFKKID